MFPIRFISVAFLAVVGVAVAECAQIVGVLLVFTLMVGPASDADLLDAAGSLGLRGWVEGLDDGLDTAVDEALSAGERQLVGLLRVARSPAVVLVLDEATSDLDASTASLVEGALDRLAADRAVVVVAHRPETIASAGWVVELG